MNLPLMSPAELDNAVYKLVAKEFGVANAMRFIARHTPSDGINYTQERQSWLPQEPSEVERLFKKADSDFERLMSEACHGRSGGSRHSKSPSRKSGGRREK